jgi:hypothetical protein
MLTLTEVKAGTWLVRFAFRNDTADAFTCAPVI